MSSQRKGPARALRLALTTKGWEFATVESLVDSTDSVFCRFFWKRGEEGVSGGQPLTLHKKSTEAAMDKSGRVPSSPRLGSIRGQEDPSPAPSRRASSLTASEIVGNAGSSRLRSPLWSSTIVPKG